MEMKGIWAGMIIYGLVLLALPIHVTHMIFMALGAVVFLGLFAALGWRGQWLFEDWYRDNYDE